MSKRRGRPRRSDTVKITISACSTSLYRQKCHYQSRRKKSNVKICWWIFLFVGSSSVSCLLLCSLTESYPCSFCRRLQIHLYKCSCKILWCCYMKHSGDTRLRQNTHQCLNDNDMETSLAHGGYPSFFGQTASVLRFYPKDQFPISNRIQHELYKPVNKSFLQQPS